jgi:hypothetical protein
LAHFVATDGATSRPWSGAALIAATDAADARAEAMIAAVRQLPVRRYLDHGVVFEPLEPNWIYTRADGRRYRMVTVAVPIEEDEVVPLPESDDGPV